MSVCASTVKAEVARFTLTDICGAPITGPGSAQVTTDSFTEIGMTPNYEAGQRFLLRKANGEPCVNTIDASFLNWVDEVTTLCTIDVDLITMVTGQDPILDGAEFTGTVFGDSLITSHFSKEVWQPVYGEGACDVEGNQQWVYWAFPHEFDAQMQAFTFANDVFTFGFSSKTQKASPLWDIGNPWLADSPAATWGPGKHYAYSLTTVPPPVAACGAVEIGS